jgi:Holliday junction resolvasome RuvABC DNA-binding subunit
MAGQAAMNDALSALVNLGYARAEAWAVLRDLVASDAGANSASLIGAALKELGNKERR